VRRTLAISCGLLLLVGVAGSGCSSTEKIHLTESGTPDFQRLQIVYEVNSNGGLARLDEPPAVRTVGLTDSSQAEPTHANPAAPSVRLRLEIQYPYPGVHEDFVHATLKVLPAASKNSTIIDTGDAPPPGLRGFSNANSRGGGMLFGSVGPPVDRGPKSGEELLVIDMPKTELNALFVDLANDGFFKSPKVFYFKSPSVKAGDSHLEVSFNEGQVAKDWTREPRLEQLVDLLKRHGTPTLAQPVSGPHPGYYTGRTGKS
jgi:hypothetical protein